MTLKESTSPEIAKYANLHPRSVQRLLNKLEELGLVQNIGESYSKRWRYTPPMPVFNIDGLKLDSEQLVVFLEKRYGLDIRLER